jgi:hypothetical protein
MVGDMSRQIRIFGELHPVTQVGERDCYVGRLPLLGVVLMRTGTTWEATITGPLDHIVDAQPGFVTAEQARDWAEQTARQMLTESLEQATLSRDLDV